MAKSKKNHRSWTTVAIGRSQYDLLKRATRKSGASPKQIVNLLTDQWAREALGIPNVTATIYIPKAKASQ